MGETEIKIYVALIGAIVLVFIIGIILFIFQYRKRKLVYEKEKALIEEQHKLELLNNQLLIQQQTMQFIGSEIHDSVTQKLTLASIYSQKLEFENQQPVNSEKLQQISRIINDSLTELRDLSKTLTDNRLQHVSLTDLLATECERVNDTGICRASLENNFNRPINIAAKSFLFRVIQEFIQNSLKHSGCKTITINLEDGTNGLNLTISDDGKGFDPHSVRPGGIGLANMKRRISLIGGRFDLISRPGEGTRLQLFIDNSNLLTG
ncbi:MAG TPA: ATP-binding protein [Chitinophagaceae bacterium]|nr:ATP-binding protein [Chitinophagaceae bacterium]